MTFGGEEEKNDFPTLRLVTVIILGLTILTFLIGGWYTIDSGQRGVLLTWGRASTNPVEPGFHFKWPIAQGIVKFDVRTQKYGAEASSDSYESAASKDLQIVKANIAVNYHVNALSVSEIYSTVGKNYENNVITPAIHDTMKAVTAQYTAEELITKREAVRDEMQRILTDKLKVYDINVETVNIVKFDFSEGFNQAIETKVTAEQNALAEQNKLKTIEFQAQQKVAQAQGERDAIIAQAEGEARRTLLNAQAEAEKIRLQNEELAKSPQYVELIKVQQWDGHLPVTFNGGATPFIDMRQLVASSYSEKTSSYSGKTSNWSGVGSW